MCFFASCFALFFGDTLTCFQLSAVARQAATALAGAEEARLASKARAGKERQVERQEEHEQQPIKESI